MGERFLLREADVLLVVDVQNDFFESGAVAVPRAESVVPAVNRLIEMFPHVVLTQKWHLRGHVSFASSHAGRRPYDVISGANGDQLLWPDHCMASRDGAEFHTGLNTARASLLLRKGQHPGMDGTSAFLLGDGRTPTGLAGYLRARGVRRVFLAGLPTDFGVRFSAQDARRDGFEAVVVDDAVRGLGVRTSLDDAWMAMAEFGVRRIASEDLLPG